MGQVDTPAPRKKSVWVWVLVCCAVAVATGVIALFFMIETRRCGFDSYAAMKCRCYATAQLLYHKTDWRGDGKRRYAESLPDLYIDSASGKRIEFIDQGFAEAHGPASARKDVYVFQECKTIGGKPIDWTTDFALCATPAVYSQASRDTLLIRTDGTVWNKDLRGCEFVDDFPKDPEAAGWKREY